MLLMHERRFMLKEYKVNESEIKDNQGLHLLAAQCAEQALDYKRAKRCYTKFDPEYFSSPVHLKQFEDGAKKAVDILFEQAKFKRAVNTAGAVSSTYQKQIKKLVQRVGGSL